MKTCGKTYTHTHTQNFRPMLTNYKIKCFRSKHVNQNLNQNQCLCLGKGQLNFLARKEPVYMVVSKDDGMRTGSPLKESWLKTFVL